MRGSKLSKKNRRRPKPKKGEIRNIVDDFGKPKVMGSAGMLGNIGGGAVIKGASLLKQGFKNFGKSKLIEKGLAMVDKKLNKLKTKKKKKSSTRGR